MSEQGIDFGTGRTRQQTEADAVRRTGMKACTTHYQANKYSQKSPHIQHTYIDLRAKVHLFLNNTL
jgi:hypothetical protein